MTCPQCAAPLRQVRAAATIGYLLLLDQCPGCGGIWFDRWEVFPLDAGAAAGLDPVDQDALCAPAPRASGSLRCPRCRARMSPFRDPLLPPDACIERCSNCDGMWFNRGALRRFKARVRPPLGKADFDRLARRASPQQSWPVVSDLDSAWRSDAEPAAAEEVRAGIASGALWLLVRVLLRLLLRL